jgi:hypothetical protein
MDPLETILGPVLTWIEPGWNGGPIEIVRPIRGWPPPLPVFATFGSEALIYTGQDVYATRDHGAFSF